MNTIKVYTRVSETKVTESVKPAGMATIERDFKRYAKTYRLAYGYFPTDYSLSVQLKEYTGVTLDRLKQWVTEIVL